MAVMDEARRAVGKDRGPVHGTMLENFRATARLWSAYLTELTGVDVNLDPHEAAEMMVLLKISRTIHGNSAHVDHYVDEAGYAAIAGALAMNRRKQNDV